MNRPYRAWINQPSINQWAHRHHGKQGIAINCPYDPNMVDLWFSVGDAHSMRIPKVCLSKGDYQESEAANELLDLYANEVIDGMGGKLLAQYAHDQLYNSLKLMSYDEVRSLVADQYPHLLDE